LLQKDPKRRIGKKEIRAHKFFGKINWDQLERKESNPPFKPRHVSCAHVLPPPFPDALSSLILPPLPSFSLPSPCTLPAPSLPFAPCLLPDYIRKMKKYPIWTILLHLIMFPKILWASLLHINKSMPRDDQTPLKREGRGRQGKQKREVYTPQ
jgi:hypothetical protein